MSEIEDTEELDQNLDDLDNLIRRDEFRFLVRKVFIVLLVVTSLGWLGYWAVRGGLDLVSLAFGI